MTRRSGLGLRRRGWLNLGAAVALLAAANLVPQDTSLAEVRRTGQLRACTPETYPPLVTGDPAAPGFDVELLGAVARRLGLRLALVANPAIGQDFNPRNWRITRAQCEVVAGGVVQSPATQGFLQTLSTGAATGWVLISPDEPGVGQNRRFAVLPGSGRLDRLALSGYLRGAGASVTLVRDPAGLAAAIESGDADGGIAERFAGGEVAAAHPGWHLDWLEPERLGTYPLAIGFWKGDTTLKRAFGREVADMERDGSLAALREKYAMTCPETAAAPGVVC